MPFWVAALWFVAKIALAMAIAYALRPSGDTPDGRHAAGLDQFQLPTAEVGRAIPVLFGTKDLKGPNVVWYGDLKVKPVKEKVDGGLLSGTKRVTIGYKYFLGIHMVLAHSIDKITKIYADSTKELWSGTCTGGSIPIDLPKIFGGDKSDGGISGIIDIAMGAADQVQNDYLLTAIGANVPAFRGCCCAIFRQVYLGTSVYIKPWSFIATRHPSGWYPAKAAIVDDANPAHIIYDVITNKKWGMGYNSTDIDSASFTAAADKLYAENFGLSMLWDQASSIEVFLREVLKHMDAALYIDRGTGQFKLKLIRDDYVVNDLPVFDESNIIKVDRWRRRTNEDIINTISVKFWDRNNREDSSYTVFDSALIVTMGGTVSQEIDYPGIASMRLASYVASRDLRAMSSPLADATLYTTMEGAALDVGDAFLFSWPLYGIEETVMRVISIEFSGLNEDTGIRIDCVEDVYGIDDAVYSTLPINEWVNPINTPANCRYFSAIEAPFYLMRQIKSLSDLAALPSGAGFACIAGTKPSNDAIDAEAWFNSGSGYEMEGSISFAPYAVLTASVGLLDTTWSVWGYDAEDVQAGSWAIVGNEIIRIDGTTANSITVGRGCFDTVPEPHAVDVIVMFVSDNYSVDGNQHSAGQVISAKMLPRTGLGVLDINSATALSVTMHSRLICPYPPARIRVNGNAGEITDMYGDLTLDWKHRNRNQVETTIYDNEQNVSVGPEAGTTYTVSVQKHSDHTQLYYQSEIPNEELFINAAEIDYDGQIDLAIWSERDGYASWQTQTRTFLYARAEYRVTENVEYRLTEDGDYRIIETNGVVGVSNVETPTIISPPYGSFVDRKSLTLVASDFTVISGSAAHEYTNWQISRFTDFSIIAWQSLGDEVALTSIAVTPGILSASIDYYARVQYRADSGLTYWSTYLKMTTMADDDVPYAEKMALIDFYLATSGPMWTKPNNNWDTAAPVSQWAGVTVSGGHITGIDVRGFGLRGSGGSTLDPLAASLTSFKAYDPYFEGLTITALTALSELFLFGGRIPSVTFSSALTALKDVRLYQTAATSYNVSSLTNLETLYVTGTLLTSVNLSGLTKLINLGISGTSISGSIDISTLNALDICVITNNPNLTSVSLLTSEIGNLIHQIDVSSCALNTNSIDFSTPEYRYIFLTYFNCSDNPRIENIKGTSWLKNFQKFIAYDCGVQNIDEILVGLNNSLGGRNWDPLWGYPTIYVIKLDGPSNGVATAVGIAAANELQATYYSHTRKSVAITYNT